MRERYNQQIVSVIYLVHLNKRNESELFFIAKFLV